MLINNKVKQACDWSYSPSFIVKKKLENYIDWNNKNIKWKKNKKHILDKKLENIIDFFKDNQITEISSSHVYIDKKLKENLSIEILKENEKIKEILTIWYDKLYNVNNQELLTLIWKIENQYFDINTYKQKLIDYVNTIINNKLGDYNYDSNCWLWINNIQIQKQKQKNNILITWKISKVYSVLDPLFDYFFPELSIFFNKKLLWKEVFLLEDINYLIRHIERKQNNF